MDHSLNFQNEAWGLNPKLDMPDLFPPVVMYSVLDSDPHIKYRTALQKPSEAHTQKRFEPPPSLTPELMRQLTFRVAWDSVFHEVPGDRIGLLYQNVRSQTATGTEGALTYAVLIKSTGPAGNKWLVTRATEFQGKSVCWCVPVDVEKGKMAEVVLTTENMITLESE